MLVVGWFPWATAAASCESYCKGRSGWMARLGSSRSVETESFQGLLPSLQCCDALEETPLEETPWRRLVSILCSLRNFPKASDGSF